MSKERWSQVDEYIVESLELSDPVLEAALADSAGAGLPAISVTANLGRFLSLLVRMVGARRVLEIGTLGGYSTIMLARALPVGGRLISLELDPKHADVARANIARADLEHVAEVRVGPALETLPKLDAREIGPFDLIFIDADKKSNPAYFGWAVRLARKGSVIVVDNVIRDGAILDSASQDENIRGIRELYEVMAADPRVDATALQTVGSKGYDGFAIAVVVANP